MDSLYGLYFLGLLGWQAYEANRLIQVLADWTGDGATTIGDWWLAWVFAWETPARTLLSFLGSDALRFFEIARAPQPFLVAISIVAWTVMAFGPLVLWSALYSAASGLTKKD